MIFEMVYIALGKSSSPNYKKARTHILNIPEASESSDGAIICRITSIEQYVKNQLDIIRFIQLAGRWKQVTIRMNGIKYNHPRVFYDFAEELKTEYPKYKRMIRSQVDDDFVAMNDVTYEGLLPLPYVHYPGLYGTFFAFSETIDGPIYFCSCQKNTIEKVVESRYNFDDDGDEWAKIHRMDDFPSELSELMPSWHDEKIISRFRFADGICFRCNKIVPDLIWCNPMYGGVFKQHYGWFIAEKTEDCYFKMDHGIDIGDDNPAIYDGIKRVRKIADELSNCGSEHNEEGEYHERFRQYEQAKRQLDNNIENAVREDFGHKKIGDAWVSETILSDIVKVLYPNTELKRHFRPDWLEKLELDIFLPEKKLAFEYQGIQHFKAVEHWGGKQKLLEQQEHDNRKIRICKDRGITLIHINYDEPLNVDYIKAKIAQFDHRI